MKVYLISAAAVMFLSVIVSLVIPEGKLNKSITFVMRMVCILVLIQPITGLFKLSDKNSQLSDSFDSEYVCNVYTDNQSREMEKLLKKEFDTDTECEVLIYYEDEQFKVGSVSIGILENPQKADEIYEYLSGLGYINITVYEKS